MAESLVELATREGQNIIAQAITQSSIVVTNAERAEEEADRAEEAADRAEEAMAKAQSAGSSSEAAKREAVESAEQATLIYNSFLQQYGYPFTAATAADMTDTSKIYVYVGNETGYTNGNWYYNNGTAWVSGGVYNSTAFETDKTLSIGGAAADAQVTGDNFDGIYKQYEESDATISSQATSRALSNAGGIAYDESSKVIYYAVTSKDILFLNLASRETETYKATWVFLDSSSTVIGDVHFGAINDTVIAPTGADRLVVAQRLDNTTNSVKYVKLPEIIIDPTLTIGGAAADAQVTGDNFNGIYNQYYEENAIVYNSYNQRALSNAGAVAYDANSKVIYYNVTPKDILMLDIASRDAETYKVTWAFKTNEGGTETVVGSVHQGAYNSSVVVPTGATWLVVAQRLDNTTNTVKQLKIPNNETQCAMLAKGSYESLKGGFDYGSIGSADGQPGGFTKKWVHSATLVSYDRDVVIYVKPNYHWWAHRYNADGTWISLYSSNNDYNLPLVIPKGVYFKLAITTYTNVDINLDDLKTDILVTAPLFNTYHISNANIKQIAHMGLRTAAYSTGGNLAKNYKAAADMGFTHGETDVAFTSDGVAVCIHDPSFVDETSGETVVIATTSYADLLTHNYRQGQPPSTFDEVVKTCKENGLGLYIDHLSVNFTDAKWQTLFGIVQKYAMQSRTFWMITGSQIPAKVKTYFPDANFWFVLMEQSGFSNALSICENIKTDKNEVVIAVDANAFPVSIFPDLIAQMPPSITLEVWTVDAIPTWQSYVPYVTGIVSNAMCANLARINE